MQNQLSFSLDNATPVEFPTIGRDGRFSLNTVHAAAGAVARDRPSLFLASQTFRRIEIALNEDSPNSSCVVHDQDQPMAVKEVAIAYAGWISPAFSVRFMRSIERGAGMLGRIDGLIDLESTFAAALRMADNYGLRGNQALLSAARAVRLSTGVDPAYLLGVDSVVVPEQEKHFTPTTLGRRSGLSARAFNLALAAAGLQERVGRTWVATPLGAPYALLVDVLRTHDDGQPVQQLRWYASVLDYLSASAAPCHAEGQPPLSRQH